MDIGTLAVGQEVSESWLYEPQDGPGEGRDQIKQRMAVKAAGFKVTLSEPVFEDVTANDLRVSSFVDAKEWPHGTRCLIGTSRVVMAHSVFAAPESRGAGFLGDLSEEALIKLRTQTRAIAKQYGEELTDAECDEIIAEKGPDCAERVVAKIVAG